MHNVYCHCVTVLTRYWYILFTFSFPSCFFLTFLICQIVSNDFFFVTASCLHHTFSFFNSSNNLFSSSILISLSAYSQLFVYPEVPNNGILLGKSNRYYVRSSQFFCCLTKKICKMLIFISNAARRRRSKRIVAWYTEKRNKCHFKRPTSSFPHSWVVKWMLTGITTAGRWCTCSL